MLAIFVIFHSVSIALFPFYGHFWLLCIGSVLNGSGAGCIDALSNIWLVDMWPTTSATLLLISQFVYASGCITIPIVTSPFLYGNTTKVEGDNITTTLVNVTISERQQSLAFPFLATGTLQITVPIVLFIMYFVFPYIRIDPPTVKSSLRRVSVVSVIVNIPQPNEPQSNSSKIRYRRIKLVLTCIAFGTYVGFETNYFFFSSTLWQKVASMEAPEAAKLSSILASSYALGRLFTAAISMKVKPDVFVTYHLGILGAAMVGLFFGRTSHSLIYAGTAGLGFGMSVIYPGILAVVERHLSLTDKIVSIYTFAAGLMALGGPLVIGGYIEKSPLIVFTVSGVLIPTTALSFAAACALIYFDR